MQRVILGSSDNDFANDPGCGMASWYRHRVRMIKETLFDGRKPSAGVPCNGCNACCRSGYKVPMKPGDDMSLWHGDTDDGERMLPRAEDGSCAYLIDGKCSVYAIRPQECRTYDCRLFAFAGVMPGGEHRKDVAQRVRGWDIKRATRARDDKLIFLALRMAHSVAVEQDRSCEVSCGLAFALIERMRPLAEARLQDMEADPVKYACVFGPAPHALLNPEAAA